MNELDCQASRKAKAVHGSRHGMLRKTSSS